jgi:serine/threonine protein kinase/tetratricopeptide (TPR) repeat protein
MSANLTRARDLFMHAVGVLPPEEWDRYVAEACSGDAELAAQVRHMLQVHREAGSFLDRPAAAGALDDGGRPVGTARQVLKRSSACGTIDESADCTGTIIAGRYKLLQQIGEGGMGTVWMGEQTEPVKRRVAVKLIRVERGQSKTILSRFEAERQAIALMDYPNIARLLDAGEATTAQAGGTPRPFFVMELVKGLPLTEFCDTHKLGIPERLRLFMQVCAAVQHAHQKGVIHRDLKPSNILVESHDGKPVPKIIDFGLAKATTGLQLSDHTLFTALGTVMGTPLYMAPEQAGASAVDVDTRADIYALGIILYELLTGSTPITRDTLKKAALDEMLKLIREQEAPTPSSRLSSVESAPSVAANRQTEPAKLGRLVKGELDWIVLKALAKERDRRYETANGFAKDVERFLNHEPVTAGPPTVAYRLRKFVRRNRGPVAAAGLVLLALLGGMAGTAWGLVRAEQQKRLAEANEREAVAERDAKAAALDAKAVALKAEQRARAHETKARQQAFTALRSMTTNVVERKFAQESVLTDDDHEFFRGIIAQYDAFAALKEDDPDSRALRAEGRWRIGLLRSRLGELREAEKAYDESVSISRQLAVDFPSRADLHKWLAFSLQNRSELLSARGRQQEAEKDQDEALSFFEQQAVAFPNQPGIRNLLAKSHNNRGHLLWKTGRLKEAEREYDQAVAIEEQLATDFPNEPRYRQSLAVGYTRRGNQLREMGRPNEAEKDYDRAQSTLRQLVTDFPNRTEFHDALAASHNDRGNLLWTTGRLKEAEKDYDRALSISKQLAADFPSQPGRRRKVATAHNNRGSLLQDMHRFKDAEQDCDQALQIYKQLATDFPSQTSSHRDLSNCHNSRGTLLEDMGRLKEAEQEYDQSLSIGRQLAADFPNQPDLRENVARTCLNLASLHQKLGNLGDAKRLLLEGRPHRQAALSANPRNPIYRKFYRMDLILLTEVHAALLEPEDAVRTAEASRDLGGDPPKDTYEAAWLLSRCIRFVAKHDKLDDVQRKDAVQFYADASMKLLRDAVSKGYKDVAEMKKSTELDPLRQREDFRNLLTELEEKGK